MSIMKQNKPWQRGDTLIEVMVAIAVLSAIVVGSFSLMNKGTAISLVVLERTETRFYIDGQIEALTYVRDQNSSQVAAGGDVHQYPAQLWEDVRAKAVSSTTAGVNDREPTSCTVPSSSFYLEYVESADVTVGNRYKVTDYPASTTADGAPEPGKGIWVEAVKSPSGVTQPYIDIYVKACWDSPASSVQGTLSSVMRLYDRQD